MNPMKAVRDRLNPSAVAVEDAQTEIREIIKRAYLYRRPWYETDKKIAEAIRNALKRIPLPRLRGDTERSLRNFARQQQYIWQTARVSPELMLLLGQYASDGFKSPRPSERFAREVAGLSRGVVEVTDKGVPLMRYYKAVWDERVKPTLQRLADGVALDPGDYSGRNSLRNLAEMEVRYNDHLQSIEDLKAAGERLVVCSAHADCSGRCAPWQGRVYSLDGTSGVVDGHRYVPLEKATDIYYTTKAGRVYKNGLLGFNCRHKLYPYRGELLPVISAKERKAEYTVTQTQRALEREVRRARVAALMLKDINKAGYLQYRAKARILYDRYVRYCEKHGRAYYPSRIKL